MQLKLALMPSDQQCSKFRHIMQHDWSFLYKGLGIDSNFKKTHPLVPGCRTKEQHNSLVSTGVVQHIQSNGRGRSGVALQLR